MGNARMENSILVLDFGGQSSQLTARRVRDLGVYSELVPNTITAKEVKERGNVKGLILSSGLITSVLEGFVIDEELFNLGIPILAIGTGYYVAMQQFGATVQEVENAPVGIVSLNIETNNDLFEGVSSPTNVWLNKNMKVTNVSSDFTIDAQDNDGVLAVNAKDKNFYGMQFQPELKTTDEGNTVLNNFIYNICKAEKSWSMDKFVEKQITAIQEKVGTDKVLCALSGGVDSSVVATLLQRAIGDQLTCVFVDHGLLRKGEADQVMETLQDKFNVNIIKIDAQERFLTLLDGVSDPETKRKIIGETFIRIFEEESGKLEGIKWLAQGTLYTDIIESGTSSAETIKSHHNVGGLPEDMEFELIEPVDTLFKDEVRAVGIELGLPEAMVWRQPFPGPGLGIRVIGAITEPKLNIVRESDFILREEIAKAGLDREIWQYFTVLTNLQSVGVKNDKRTYDYAVGIRAVNSQDGVSASFAKIPWDLLEKIGVRIMNEVPGVNRVLYDISNKPSATIEFE